MLLPRKQKFRKQMRLRGAYSGKAQKGNYISFGKYALKSLGTAEVSSRQIESARRTLTRYTRRGGKVWIRIFPHKPITRKSAETPMGSGKGAVEFHVSVVKPGTIIFEMDGIPQDKAKEALELAAYKLPIKCRFVTVNKD